jgi:hypothetical protein
MNAIGHALALAGSMTWEILWALILGFGREHRQPATRLPAHATMPASRDG